MTGMRAGDAAPDQIARRDQHRRGEGKQGGGRDSVGSGLGDQNAAGEAEYDEDDARRPDRLSEKESDGQDQEQGRRLHDGDHIGDRQAREGHDIAEDAQRLRPGPQQRAKVDGRGNGAPVSEGDEQQAAGKTGRDAAKEQHLERRKIARDQLHERIADDERGRRGEHGGDAAEI